MHGLDAHRVCRNSMTMSKIMKGVMHTSHWYWTINRLDNFYIGKVVVFKENTGLVIFDFDYKHNLLKVQ